MYVNLSNFLEESLFVMLEANYDPEVLRLSSYPFSLKSRIAGPTGHLPNEMAGKTISHLLNSGLKTAMLGHLSKESNFPALAYQTVVDELISNNSKINQEFASLLTRENIEFEREFSLGSKSFDFKVKDILIEINPTITHNSTFSPFKNNKGQDPKYHQEKSILAETNGFRCIHVWDWDDKEKIINSLKTKKKIYARDCVIKELNKEETDTFLNKYHFQNTCKNQTIRIGLFSNNELIQVISFGKPRFNKNYQYELLRLCTKFDYIIIGGSEKLFKYFINKYKPESIISYCDRSKFKGDVYQSLGFTLINKGIPTKHWYNLKTKKHLLDSSLRARGFDILLGKEYGCFGKGTSNNELMLKHGFVEIYDCGQASYKYIR